MEIKWAYGLKQMAKCFAPYEGDGHDYPKINPGSHANVRKKGCVVRIEWSDKTTACIDTLCALRCTCESRLSFQGSRDLLLLLKWMLSLMVCSAGGCFILQLWSVDRTQRSSIWADVPAWSSLLEWVECLIDSIFILATLFWACFDVWITFQMQQCRIRMHQ